MTDITSLREAVDRARTSGLTDDDNIRAYVMQIFGQKHESDIQLLSQILGALGDESARVSALNASLTSLAMMIAANAVDRTGFNEIMLTLSHAFVKSGNLSWDVLREGKRPPSLDQKP